MNAVWVYAGDRKGTALLVEFLALANHRPEVRAAIGEYGERARCVLTQILGATSPEGRIFTMASNSAAAFMLICLSRLVAMEEVVGVELGHADATAAARKLLERASVAR